MKRAVLLLVAACQASPSDYPIGPGGPGPIVIGGSADAGTGDGGDAGDAGDAGVTLRGRVCLLGDLRLPTVCDNTQRARGLRVSLGTRTTTTTDDLGSFEISAPQGSFTWHVEGDTADRIQRTAMPFGTDNTIPVISFARYEDLLNSNSVSVSPLEGSIVMRVVNAAGAVRGVTATLAGVDGVLYDSASATVWSTGSVGTDSNGVVWIPGVTTVPSPAATVRLTSPGTTTAVSAPVIVEDQTITFVTTALQ